MNYLEIIKDLFQGLGSIGVLVVVFAFWKMGFFEKKNGTNGNGKLVELQTQLETLQNNHLSHIAEKLDKIVEQNQEQLFILRRIEDKQK